MKSTGLFVCPYDGDSPSPIVCLLYTPGIPVPGEDYPLDLPWIPRFMINNHRLVYRVVALKLYKQINS